MARIRRVLRAASGLLVVLATGVAQASGSSVPAEQDKPADSPYLLSGDRLVEANVALTQQLDWNGLAGVSGPRAHAGVVLGGELGLMFVSQRVRPSLFTGIKVGAWADEPHGPFAFVEGARVRLSPLMWDIFDLYFVARADVDLQFGRSAVFRPGAGIGLRAARLAAVEVTYDVSLPLGSSFAGTQYPDLIPFGVSFGVLFDAAFGCSRNAAPQVHRDLACRLYQSAASEPADPEVCAAIPGALLASPPLDARREDDGTRAFLATLSTLVHGTVARKVALDLLGRHEALLGDWVTYEERTALAAQNGRRLTEVWTYAPVPIELRAYLGCDASADPSKPLPRPTCSEVTP